MKGKSVFGNIRDGVIRVLLNRLVVALAGGLGVFLAANFAPVHSALCGG